MGRQWVSSIVPALGALSLLAAGSVSAASAPARPFAGQTITVAFATDPPPASLLAKFTAQTGIQVKWEDVDWDSLQTKITAAMVSHTYFADVTDVDWSRVGEYYKLHWFVPLNRYFNPSGLRSDIPGLSSFTDHGTLVGMPVDSSFMVTTINVNDFHKAGIKAVPRTLTQYMADLHQLQARHVAAHPLDIPFAAAEGLSTYWYEMTGAMGGTLLSSTFQPLFVKPSSPGYKALAWMIQAYRAGLVPQGNIDLNDTQAMEGEMAQNRVATVFSDYAGQVGTIYDVTGQSKVIGQVEYVATPGLSGQGPNLENQDGMGIPVTAKHAGAAAAFINWFISPENQADFSGLNHGRLVISGFPLPVRLSSMKMLVKQNALDGGAALAALLSGHARPVFPFGAPPWYSQFSNAVYTNIHDAATHSESVGQAIAAIASTVNQLRSQH